MAAFILFKVIEDQRMEFYLEVLEGIHNAELPDTIVSDTRLIFQSVLDLIDVGYLTGTLVTTADGQVIQQVTITDSGLRFLERNASLAGQSEWRAADTALEFFLASMAMLVFFICLVLVIRHYLF